MIKKIKPQWAIGFVNFYTSDLIYYQFKQLAPIVKSHLVNIYIVDNSRNSEIDVLKKFASEFDLLNHTHFIYNGKTKKVSSEAHAEGLDLILKLVKKSDFFLTQDPDYFWLISNHIRFLENIIVTNRLHALGSSYKKRVFNGKPDFPCAYGAVYKTKDLKGINFAIPKKNQLDKNLEENNYGLHEFSFDVGWKIRKKLSNKKYESFMQGPALGLRNSFGEHSLESNPSLYYYKKEPVALHLFRGSFPTTTVEALNKNTSLSANYRWNKIKKKYAALSYELSRLPKIKKIDYLASFDKYHYLKLEPDFRVSYLGVQNIYYSSFEIKKRIDRYKIGLMQKKFKSYQHLESSILDQPNLFFIYYKKHFLNNNNKVDRLKIENFLQAKMGHQNQYLVNALVHISRNIDATSQDSFVKSFRFKSTAKSTQDFDHDFYFLEIYITFLHLLHSEDLNNQSFFLIRRLYQIRWLRKTYQYFFQKLIWLLSIKSLFSKFR